MKESEEQYKNLNKYSINLTKKAMEVKFDPVIGRDEEIRRVMLILSRRTKNNPVLIGPPGVGKTAIAEGLAQRIAEGDIPDTLKGILFSLDIGAIVAGAKHQGEFEERLKGILEEIKNAKDRIFLFIDELHIVLGAGKTSGSMDAANLLKPMLARGELRCIGATTFDEYRKYVEKDPAFERRFQPIYVGEPNIEDTISILRGLREVYETYHGVRITDDALVSAAKLSQRYIQGRFQPDKAIDLIDEACADIRIAIDSQPEVIDVLQRKKRRLDIEIKALEKEKTNGKRFEDVLKERKKVEEELSPLFERHEKETKRVKELRLFQKKLNILRRKRIEAENRRDLDTVADIEYYSIPDVKKKIEELSIIEEQNGEGRLVEEKITKEKITSVVSKWTGIPVNKLNQEQTQKLSNLTERLCQHVIGQEEAVMAVSEAIIRSQSGLGRDRQPVGGFLFLGSTGVGKTELARSLSLELFDDYKKMIRIDMSEYMESHSVSRLIGAPPGYIGYEEGGQLTEQVRRRPYSVILFDEIEKAHYQVLNLLLQILDDGSLTDGQGKKVDFTNAVMILTSNIGSEHLIEEGSSLSEKKKIVMDEVRRTIKPELLNRLDEIIIFNPLKKEDMGIILNNYVFEMEKRMEDKNIRLGLSSEVIKKIVNESYNPHYGARPLKRQLEKRISTELGRLIVNGQVTSNVFVNVLCFPPNTEAGVWYQMNEFVFQVTAISETTECFMKE